MWVCWVPTVGLAHLRLSLQSLSSHLISFHRALHALLMQHRCSLYFFQGGFIPGEMRLSRALLAPGLLLPASLSFYKGNLVSSLSHLLYQGNFFIAVLTSWQYVHSQFISSVSILFGGGAGENVLCLKLDFSAVFFLSFHVV